MEDIVLEFNLRTDEIEDKLKSLYMSMPFRYDEALHMETTREMMNLIDDIEKSELPKDIKTTMIYYIYGMVLELSGQADSYYKMVLLSRKPSSKGGLENVE